MSIFSERITDIMAKKHLTQKQLAEMANVTESAMSYYVKGERIPRVDVLSRLAGALGVTADYLIGADAPDPEDESAQQYLKRNLAKLNQDQIIKAANILRTVFDDVFDEGSYEGRKNVTPYGGPGITRDFFPKFSEDIEEITAEGIFFRDGSRIGFKECVANWPGGNNKTCIAERNSGGHPPYFLFSTPVKPTKLFFCAPKKKSFRAKRSNDEFYDLMCKLKEFGYTTYDLS